jgi:alpha-L-fucosidase
VDAIFAKTKGKAKTGNLTFSHYFGDWKHATCVAGMESPEDLATFEVRILEPGDYKVILEYACSPESAKQEGILEMNGAKYLFRTLRTSGYEKSAPVLFIKHSITISKIENPGIYTIKIQPVQKGVELFKLKTVLLEPVK